MTGCSATNHQWLATQLALPVWVLDWPQQHGMGPDSPNLSAGGGCCCYHMVLRCTHLLRGQRQLKRSPLPLVCERVQCSIGVVLGLQAAQHTRHELLLHTNTHGGVERFSLLASVCLHHCCHGGQVSPTAHPASKCPAVKPTFGL